MYTVMTESSAIPSQLSLSEDDVIVRQAQQCIPKPPEMVTFRPCEETTGTSPSHVAGTPAATSRQPTLLERRNREKRFCSASLSSLNVETIQEGGRDRTTRDDDDEGRVFRGWSKTSVGRNSKKSSLNGVLKLVSYNILAQRLVSTDRYAHCPPFALAEDYRCSLLEDQLKQFEADILVLQEVSVDVYEKPSLLGSALREKYGYVGNHVVITDAEGRPRCRWKDPNLEEGSEALYPSEADLYSPQTEPPNISPVKDISTPTNGPKDSKDPHDSPHRRSEMEGVCIFFLAERFEHCETVPITFNAIASADGSLTSRERRALQVCSHNVALITVLRDRSMPNSVYIVGTVHLIWQRTECQLWQMYQVIMKLERLKHKYETTHVEPDGDPPLVSIILAGDLNSDPNSSPLQYALHGVPPPDSSVLSSWKLFSEERRNNQESMAVTGTSPTRLDGQTATYRITDTVNHSVPLHNCYTEYLDRHPQRVTAVNPSTNGEGKVLDHILIDDQHIVCTSVLRLGERRELPTKDHPSDHLPVGVTFVPRSSLME